MIGTHRAMLLAAAMLLAGGLASCGSGGDTVDNDSCSYGAAGDQGPYVPSPPDTNGPAVGQAIPEMPHDHVQPPAKVQYEHTPPTSGCHYNLGQGMAPLTHGAYTAEIAPENWVHNLEHGYVVVLYNCPNGCDTDFQKLRDWMQRQPPDQALHDFYAQQPGITPTQLASLNYSKIVIVPYTKMDKKFAMVSWDYYDPMDALDLTEVQKFYDNHVGHSPESPGAS